MQHQKSQKWYLSENVRCLWILMIIIADIFLSSNTCLAFYFSLFNWEKILSVQNLNMIILKLKTWQSDFVIFDCCCKMSLNLQSSWNIIRHHYWQESIRINWCLKISSQLNQTCMWELIWTHFFLIKTYHSNLFCDSWNIALHTILSVM